MDNYKIIGVSGNRPSKLSPNIIPALRERINEILINFYNKGGTLMLNGAAMGVDTWFALSAIDNHVPYKNYIPFPQQADAWNSDDKSTYHKILTHGAENKIFGKFPNNKYYYTRNAAIVNDSDVMVVVHDVNCDSGGAIWTMKYALSKNKPLLEIITHGDTLDERFIKVKY